VAAQIKALGLIFFVVTDGAVSPEAGMILGAAIVLTYTTFGGMFSVAVLDFVQMACRWAACCSSPGPSAAKWRRRRGGDRPRQRRRQAGLLPGAGSLAVADLHRRLGDHDARLDPAAGRVPAHHLGEDGEHRAVGLGARRLDLLLLHLRADVHRLFGDADRPGVFNELLEKDSQLVLPTLVLQHMPLFAQVLFFGAVLSAIMSCSSATLLAPSVTFAENVVRASSRTWATTISCG
jgi:SSS family solute:Na+ symporter